MSLLDLHAIFDSRSHQTFALKWHRMKAIHISSNGVVSCSRKVRNNLLRAHSKPDPPHYARNENTRQSSTHQGSCLQWRHGNDLLPSDRRNESGVKTSSCAVHQAPGSWRGAPWHQQQLPSSSPSAAGRGAGAQPQRPPGASEGTSLFQSLTFHKHFIYQKARGRTHSVRRRTATCTAS